MVNVKTRISFIIKLIIVIGALFFIINKLVSSPDIKNIPNVVSNWNFNQYLVILYVFILMLINWAIETIKWRTVLPKDYRICFLRSYKAVLAGITAGSVTPNRIGEFGGRVFFLKPQHRKQAIPTTIIADISQFITTICFGLIAFSVLGYKKINIIADYSGFANTVLITGLALMIISVLVYFKPSIFKNYLFKIKKIKKYESIFSHLDNLKISVQIKVLLLSILRYIIFIIQFYLIFNLFEIEINLINTFIAVANVYFANAIIPNLPITEIALRSSFAIIFVGVFSDATVSIVLSTISVYTINVAIPALFGGLFILIKKK